MESIWHRVGGSASWRALPAVALLSCLYAGIAPAQQAPETMLGDLMQLKDTRTARISSANPTGANSDFRPLPAGESLLLADIGGAGVVRHLYFSIWGGDHYLRDLVLRAYWDGSDTPCVEVPFGDFFGLGHERPRFFSSLPVTVNPGDLGVFGTFGFNSYFPMPYARGARLTLTNEGTEAVYAVWYHVEYETMEQLPPDLGRFHASWHRENPTVAVGEHINTTLHEAPNTTGDENYVLLDAEGRGHIAGIFLNVDNLMGGWYGEGDDMIFIDGEGWPPSYAGTGSEEVFGGGACPTEEYAGPYTGYHVIGNLDYTGKVSMYRFYLNDPVRFRKSVRMTIEHGHANNIANDYSSTVFWYQSEPHKRFPILPPALERRPRAGTDPHDTAFLRLIGLRQKVLAAWIGSVRSGTPLPEDVTRALKQGVTRTYLDREYDRLPAEIEALERRLDDILQP